MQIGDPSVLGRRGSISASTLLWNNILQSKNRILSKRGQRSRVQKDGTTTMAMKKMKKITLRMMMILGMGVLAIMATQLPGVTRTRTSHQKKMTTKKMTTTMA